MKTYERRTQDILNKTNTMKKQHQRKRLALLSSLCCCVLAVGLVLFWPYNTQAPSIAQYQGSEYYELIEKLNPLTFQAPSDKNNFEAWFSDLRVKLESVGGDMVVDAPNMSGSADMEAGTGNYEEVTDNQVAGVIEGDRIKRSDKYIFYLYNQTLRVYSIDKDASAQVGEFTIDDTEGIKLSAYEGEWEMFLSADCTTVTIVSSCYDHQNDVKLVCALSLDVSDPGKITEIGRIYFTGSYLSARMVGNDLLLMSQFRVRSNPDYSQESDFVPGYGQPGAMQCMDMDDILVPEDPSNTNYTIITRLDPKDLQVKDAKALLSYASEVYVSADKIFATRAYSSKTSGENGLVITESMTEISAVSYSGNSLEYLGSIHAAGSVLNQYSMDEKDGILRVVTTTSKSSYRETSYGENISADVMVDWSGNATSASLYCVDLNTWDVIASVQEFAPKGETVRSVRFDGDHAYVCTAVQLMDPVFFFDLSDLSNITYKDTGTITGYSTSLVNLGNGYLLGIGYGDSWNLKIEVYEETADGVASVCSYEANASFSEDYKSYLIDRENRYIGLGVNSWNDPDFVSSYVLLHFDGYELIELVKVPLAGDVLYKRAVIVDGWLYMFGSDFAVEQL